MVIARFMLVPVYVLHGWLELWPVLFRFTMPLGVRVREPALRLSKACEKVVVVSRSEERRVGNESHDGVVPSYVKLAVTSQMRNATLLIMPVELEVVAGIIVVPVVPLPMC